jgi:hypothetical protein
VFSSGANYGKALIDLPLGEWGAPPLWRAGANVSTRLNTEATLGRRGADRLQGGLSSFGFRRDDPPDGAWTQWPVAPQAGFEPATIRLTDTATLVSSSPIQLMPVEFLMLEK